MTEFKHLIRLGDADLKGDKPLYYALREIKGVSYSFSNVICNLANLEKNRKVGSLTDDEVSKIKDILNDPLKYNIKTWLFNRRKDYDTGENKHIFGVNVKLRRDFDIKRIRAIKSYRGMRHSYGLPVRGQRTRAHFRKGATIGVKKKAGKKGRI